MSDEMLPLPIPLLDYVSFGPYMVTFEWGFGVGLLTTYRADLTEALFLFYDDGTPMIGLGAPARRVIVDARGVTIHGCLTAVVEVDFVITREVIALMQEIGVDKDAEIELLDKELEMMWRQP